MVKRTFLLIWTLFCGIFSANTQVLEWHNRDGYADVQYIGRELFKVKTLEGKWGILNAYGKMSVEAAYDSITPLVEDRALLLDRSGQQLLGIVNEQGAVIRKFNQHEIIANYPYFKEGKLAYGVVAGNIYLFGYLDKDGNTCIQPQFYWASPFVNGVATIEYKSQNFGLIDTQGAPAAISNKKFYFMSSPVNNEVLGVVSGRKGDRLVLFRIENGGFVEVRELEGETKAAFSNNFRLVSCLNGHVYYLDGAMRLLSSSFGDRFNEPMDYFVYIPSRGGFYYEPHGTIKFQGTSLLSGEIGNAVFYEDKFAVITQMNGVKKIMKLNKRASLLFADSPLEAVFYHNECQKTAIKVNLNALGEDTQVELGIVGLNGDGEDRVVIPKGTKGDFSFPISYFIPSERREEIVHRMLTCNLYVEGFLYKTEECVLSGIHKAGFSVSNATAPEFTTEDGKATVSFSIYSLNGRPSPSTEVRVTGDANQVKTFAGADAVNIVVPVTVSEFELKEFVFTVTIKEEGCPSYSTVVKKSIKNHYLQ